MPAISIHRAPASPSKMRPVSHLPPVHPCRSAPRRRQRRAPCLGTRRPAGLARTLWWAAGLALGAGTAGAEPVAADNGLGPALLQEVARMAQEAATALMGSEGPPPRIEVTVGRLDPRLKLAPCQTIVPYLPAGARPLGTTRMGLRCTQGSQRWNVSLPVQVKLWAPSLVASTILPAGTVLEARHLATAPVDLAEQADPALARSASVLGHTLARGLAAGQALRQGDLKTRLWFNTGDTVRIVAVGPGYAVSSEGQAMAPGVAGQNIRVRTDGGRIVTGIASADRRVDVAL